MKKVLPITLLVLTSLLSGCKVEHDKLFKAQANYICRDAGGVYYINIGGFVTCNSGKGVNAKAVGSTVLPEGWRVGDEPKHNP